MFLKWMLVYVTIVGTDNVPAAHQIKMFATREECAEGLRSTVEVVATTQEYNYAVFCMPINMEALEKSS